MDLESRKPCQSLTSVQAPDAYPENFRLSNPAFAYQEMHHKTIRRMKFQGQEFARNHQDKRHPTRIKSIIDSGTRSALRCKWVAKIPHESDAINRRRESFNGRLINDWCRSVMMSCLIRNRLPCVTGAAARHPNYAGLRRRDESVLSWPSWAVYECECPHLFFRLERILISRSIC